MTEPLFTSAIKRGRELDEHLKRTGKTVGPLHGLPVSIKDTFNVKGVDSSIGLAALAFKPATENARLVDLLLSLGAIIISKTNLPQTIAALDSCNHLFGRTLNPLNRQLSAGGSSGGEGVLLSMRGSMIGFGTDVGGSIRIPAMCNGIYGFKPSVGRVPYGGQETGQFGKGRDAALKAVAGPLARSVEDLGVVMQEIVPRAVLFGDDCIPGKWESNTAAKLQDSTRKFTVGILRKDGLVEPLPPVAKVLDEVAQVLHQTDGIDVVEIPVPAVFKRCQALAGRLMEVDGNSRMMDLLESTSEPLIPWLQSWMRRRGPITEAQLNQLQAERSQIEEEMLKIWTLPEGNGFDNEGPIKNIDAIICPVAPHPVPEIDRYNGVGYTSSFVLLDYPAGTIPVRKFKESDLEIGKEMTAEVLGSWDKKNRKLCKKKAFLYFLIYYPHRTRTNNPALHTGNQKTVDRRVYVDSPLSIQVVTPKRHDYELFRAMKIIDRALRRHIGEESRDRRVDSKL